MSVMLVRCLQDVHMVFEDVHKMSVIFFLDGSKMFVRCAYDVRKKFTFFLSSHLVSTDGIFIQE